MCFLMIVFNEHLKFGRAGRPIQFPSDSSASKNKTGSSIIKLVHEKTATDVQQPDRHVLLLTGPVAYVE